jgi:hypothetical protein
MKTDEVSFMLTWVQGYMAGTEEELRMDPEVLGQIGWRAVPYRKANRVKI